MLKGLGGLPLRKLNDFTVIHDSVENEPIHCIEGIVVLPAGAIVELEPPHTAEVVRVRLTTDANNCATVCLDVRVLT